MAIIQQLAKSRTPLILLAEQPGDDAAAAALALAHWSEARGASPVVAGNTLRDKLPFLPRPRHLTKEVRATQDFVLQFSTATTPIRDVRVERDRDRLRLIITPEGDYIDPRDFSFAPAKPHYDTIVLVGADAFDTWQNMGEAARLTLADVPRISLIGTRQNPIISAEVAQIMLGAEQTAKQALPENAAQCLLAGIVSVTEGLCLKPISAELFRLSAKLMRSGADLQQIMMQMYKTVTFDFLKLWGKYLQNLQTGGGGRVVWSFLKTDVSADNEELSAALARTAKLLPESRILLALPEKSKHATGAVMLPNTDDFSIFAETLGQTAKLGSEHIFSFISNKPTSKFIEEIIELSRAETTKQTSVL